jgi:hypothetical protein
MPFYLPPPFGEVTSSDAGPIACAVLLLCCAFGLIGQCLGMSDPSAPAQRPWVTSAETKAFEAAAKVHQMQALQDKAAERRRAKFAKRHSERDAAEQALRDEEAALKGPARKPNRPAGKGGRGSSADRPAGRGRGKGGRGAGPSGAPTPPVAAARNELAALE